MSLFNQSKTETDVEMKENTAEKKKVSALELLKNDQAILEGIAAVYQKIDSMDKNNKKFLMAATMNDGRTEQLEKDVYKMKMGVIALLDQIDFMVSAVHKSGAEELLQGLSVFCNKIGEITKDLGIEAIPVTEKMKFNPQEQECTNIEHLEDCEDDVVVGLLQSGYKDRKNGKILRCAKVSVNKQ